MTLPINYLLNEHVLNDEEAEAFIREKADELESTYGVSFDIRTDIAERNGINVMTVYFTAEICVGGI